MKAFIDSVILIGVFYKQDQWHALLIPIINGIENGKIQGFISEYILIEVLTFLKRRSGLKAARTVQETILESNLLHVEYINEKLFIEGLNIFSTFLQLSVVDATSIVIMKELNIRDIYSFDTDFDIVEGISRHYSISY